MASPNDLKIWRGTDYQARFDMLDTAGAVEDVTGSTFEMTLCHSGSTILTLTSGAGITVPDATNGKVYVDFTAAQTAAFPPVSSPVRYELIHTFPNGRREKRQHGLIIIQDCC